MAKQLTKLDDLRNQITALKPQIKAALPAHVTVEKFTRVLMTAISSNKDLQSATRPSLFASCLKLAQQGLMPDGREAAIVTFKTKSGDIIAQDMPMVAGLLKLARNSGEIQSISPHAVYENDSFEYWIDETGEKLNHRPELRGSRGKITHVYCLAITKDGGRYIEVMSKEDIEKVKAVSRSQNGPWKTWYEQMALKSCIRRLAKRLPSSTDLDGAFDSDNQTYDLNPQMDTEDEEPRPKHAVDVTPSEPSKKSRSLADAMGVKNEAEPDTVEHESPAAIQMEETPI